MLPLERGSTVLYTGEGFVCISPPSRLKSLYFSALSTKRQFHFVQCYSVLSDFHPMAKNHYVTRLDEFSVIMFYLLKVISLGEIG